MKAVYLSQKSGADALFEGEIPQPNPNEGDVLVKVHATSVMPSEFQWFPTFNARSGNTRSFPVVLSHEFSGYIESLGPNVTGFSVGEEVYGINDWFANGAQAEYCVAPALALARKPHSLDHAHAAVVPISALTAWQGLFEKAGLERRQRVLIHGAAGGVGGFAVQLARWRGAHVIATASEMDMDFVRALGADEVVNYRKTAFEQVAREVDVVFDTVGCETLDRSWTVLKEGGKLVTIATQSQVDADQRTRDAFMLVRADGAQLAHIAELIDAGELRVFVDHFFSLSEAREAYARAQERGIRGKIALRVTKY